MLAVRKSVSNPTSSDFKKKKRLGGKYAKNRNSTYSCIIIGDGIQLICMWRQRCSWRYGRVNRKLTESDINLWVRLVLLFKIRFKLRKVMIMDKNKEKIFVAIKLSSTESMSCTGYEIMGADCWDSKKFIIQDWFIKGLPKAIKLSAKKSILKSGTCDELRWREKGKDYGYTDYTLIVEERDLIIS